MKSNQAPAIEVRRVYDHAPRARGKAFLVDRLWPRGVKKEALAGAAWLKAAGPSDALRQWFGHDAVRWPEFKRRYFAELKKNPEAWQPLAQAARQSPITLLFGARDTERNNAVALREFLEKA